MKINQKRNILNGDNVGRSKFKIIVYASARRLDNPDYRKSITYTIKKEGI